MLKGARDKGRQRPRTMSALRSATTQRESRPMWHRSVEWRFSGRKPKHEVPYPQCHPFFGAGSRVRKESSTRNTMRFDRIRRIGARPTTDPERLRTLSVLSETRTLILVLGISTEQAWRPSARRRVAMGRHRRRSSWAAVFRGVPGKRDRDAAWHATLSDISECRTGKNSVSSAYLGLAVLDCCFAFCSQNTAAQ